MSIPRRLIRLYVSGRNLFSSTAHDISGIKSKGKLIAYNGSQQEVFNMPAVSGSNNPPYRTIPPGKYNVGPFVKTTDPVFTSHGIGFKVIIGPDPYDNYLKRYRSLLRIHPARNDGTQGCIGLRGNNYELQTIEKILKVSLDSNKTIPLNVIVNGY